MNKAYKQYFDLIFGSTLLTLGIYLFVTPNGINFGGVIGLAQIIEIFLRRFIAIRSDANLVGMINFLINVPLFLIGYRVNDATRFGNTVRLVVFDEAFNKMDSDRITESVLLLRKMGLQAIICTPPDKVSDIMPIADRTLLVDKSGYRMHIIPFGKEMQNEGSTGDPESSAG